ncbi:MAG: rhomboid family intramembrane serine protease [Chloroflexi bacterium]|nr:rhomboid family intramembrane serine protease [Chloroflexota bacterium]
MFPLSDSDLVTHRRPVINLIIIGVTTAVFLFELLVGLDGRVVMFYQFGVIPAKITQGLSSVQTPFGFNIESPIPNFATIFTSMFLHGDWLHFIVNMLFLWVFGDNIEDRFGHFKYLLFYLAAGIAATGLHIASNPASVLPTIGASGAIAGVLGAYVLFYPRSRIRTAVVLLFFVVFPRIRAYFLLGFWFVLQFFGGLGSLGPSAQTGGVAYWAHIGGFVTGILVAAVYMFAGPRRTGSG